MAAVGWQGSERGIFLSRIYELKRRRDYGAMEEEALTALERFSGDTHIEILLADAQWHRGRRSEAESLLDRLDLEARDLPEFHALRGGIAFERREYEAALEHYRLAASLQRAPFYLKRQADCLLQLNRPEEALALLDSVGSGSDDVFALSTRARAFEKLGRVEDAERCYSRIIEIRPEDSFARSRLMKLRVSRKSPDRARREIERMVRIPSQKEDPAILSLQADQLKANRRFGEAAELYGRLAEMTGGRQRDHFRRQAAFAHYRAACFGEAYPLLRRLMGENPRDPYVRSTLIATARQLDCTPELVGFFHELAGRAPANRFLLGVARKLKGPGGG